MDGHQLLSKGPEIVKEYYNNVFGSQRMYCIEPCMDRTLRRPSQQKAELVNRQGRNHNKVRPKTII